MKAEENQRKSVRSVRCALVRGLGLVLGVYVRVHIHKHTHAHKRASEKEVRGSTLASVTAQRIKVGVVVITYGT